MTTIFHKAYNAEVTLDFKKNLLRGKITNIEDKDVIFEGETIATLRIAFEDAVEVYEKEHKKNQR